VAVVKAEDERQQDQRNGHDDVRAAVKSGGMIARSQSATLCHREHSGPANASAITAAAVESTSNTIGPAMMIAASGLSRALAWPDDRPGGVRANRPARIADRRGRL
jgi:hypothetical protein